MKMCTRASKIRLHCRLTFKWHLWKLAVLIMFHQPSVSQVRVKMNLPVNCRMIKFTEKVTRKLKVWRSTDYRWIKTAYYTFQNAGFVMKQNEMNLYLVRWKTENLHFVKWKICTLRNEKSVQLMSLWHEKSVLCEMENLHFALKIKICTF